MNNKELYKNAMSGVRHSDDAIERIFDMTVDKKKTNGLLLKRLACATLAFAVLIGSGFGINNAIHNSNSNEFDVLVAYAATGEFCNAGAQSRQNLLYALYVTPEKDKEKAKEAESNYQKDYNDNKEQIEKLGQDGYWSSLGGSNLPCFDKDNKQTASLRTIEGGILALGLDDYTDVKFFQVENTSEYGYIRFEHLAQYENLLAISEKENALTDKEARAFYGIGHKFKITGDELRRSQQADLYSGGIKEPLNIGYSLNWYPSDELCSAIGDNTDFDLTQIQDTITFTVEFNDSTVKTASINLYFDSDGYMHIEQ